MRRISISFILLLCAIAIAVPATALGPYVWCADSGFGNLPTKARIIKNLDNLKAHSVNGVWVQVELYNDGAVNYKKTTLSGLPTAARFKSGDWANDDFLAYTISEAKKRGMQVMIKLHGSNHAAWDKNPSWQKLDSKGKPVLWSGTLKNFCVNSPYWDKIFFPMVKEIGQNYDIDGFYLDTCQVAYSTTDCCFCPACKARFEQETGKPLPLKPVDSKNWADPIVKTHAAKRVAWVNEFYEKFAAAVQEDKPNAWVFLNESGGYNSYKDTVSARHAGRFVTFMTPEPVNTPRMYSVVRNAELKKAKQKPLPDMQIALQEILPQMDRFVYEQFMVKTMLADGARKPVVPLSRYWFTGDETMGSTELEIRQIEEAIHSGAKGWCFFGYLANALETGKTKGTAWEDPKFIAYLKDLTTGPRAKWLADMQPDCRVGILYDREAGFWNADYWNRLKEIGMLFGYAQHQRKFSVGLISTSEPDEPGFGKTGYKLTPEILSKYSLVIAPGLDYASADDLRALKTYVDNTGKLLILGPIARHGKFLGLPATDDAYSILGITTESAPEPSGFVLPAMVHPIYMIPGRSPSDLKTPFRFNADKNAVLTCKPKYGDGWTVFANEYTDTGKRPCILFKSEAQADPTKGVICYINSDNISRFSTDMMYVLGNLLAFVPARPDVVSATGLSDAGDLNAFISEDGMARYFHIVSSKSESDVMLRIRADQGLFPTKCDIIVNGGEPVSISAVRGNRMPAGVEMVIYQKGSAIVKLPKLPPGFAIVKIQYEKREIPQS